MRIGIVMTFLEPERNGGAETYARMLVKELQNLQNEDEFFLFVPKGFNANLRNARFQAVPCNIDASRRYRRIIWDQVALPEILRKERLDLVHFPYGTLPLRYHGRAVVTIHDTLRFFFSEELSPAIRWYKAAIESHIRSTRRHVIGVSHFDAKVISERIGVPREFVSPIYHGVSERFFDVRSKHNGKPVVLWFGRPYIRKNVGVLFRALQILQATRSECPILRVVGVQRGYGDEFSSLVSTLGIEHIVSLEPPIPHSRIQSVFSNATVFAYPSRYESFGIPVLEALAAGIPTICADIPAFRELHGDKVLYADPGDAEQFAEHIATLLDDQTLRQQVSDSGRRHAREFTWERCARETLEVYRRAGSAG